MLFGKIKMSLIKIIGDKRKILLSNSLKESKKKRMKF